MQNIQEVFIRIQESKKKMKDLKEAYKDALSTSQEYEEVVEKMKALREKKKQIENTTKESFASEFRQLDDLKIDIASDMELMNDIAVTQIMKGEAVELTDQYENQYEPIVNVKFKKIS